MLSDFLAREAQGKLSGVLIDRRAAVLRASAAKPAEASPEFGQPLRDEELACRQVGQENDLTGFPTRELRPLACTAR